MLDSICSPTCAVKWLGVGAITPLAVDGKGTKANLLESVARWVAARGRNVTQPGALLGSSMFFYTKSMYRIFQS